MAPRKLRKHQAVSAVTAPAAAAAPAGAATASYAAASGAGEILLEASQQIENLLSCPDSSLLEGIADLCKVLTQLFAQPSSAGSASADQQQKRLAIKALHQLKLPHLVAKLLSFSSTQPDGQLISSKWQQPGYCRSVVALLQAHGEVINAADLELEQDDDVLQAGLLLLQSGVLQQVTLAQQQLAELLDQQQQQQQQQGNQQLQPQLATQLSADLLYHILMYCDKIGLFMALQSSEPGVMAALYVAVGAAAQLGVLWLQHTTTGEDGWGGELMLRGALTATYEAVLFAGYIQRMPEGHSASSSSNEGGSISSSCSADSGACSDCPILMDAAVLRLQLMLLAVYTRAICQEAPSSSSNRHSSTQQFPPQQVEATAATDSAPTQPRSLLQLSEDLWTVCSQHSLNQQQQQQSLACLQLLADTVQTELCQQHYGPEERLQQLVVLAAVSIHPISELPPLSINTTDEQNLSSNSSSSRGSGTNGSSSSKHLELQQLLQQSSWVLLPLLLAIGANTIDEDVTGVCLMVSAARVSITAWATTAADQWLCTYNAVVEAVETATAAVTTKLEAAAGGSVSEGGAAAVAPTAAAAAAAGSALEAGAATAVAATIAAAAAAAAGSEAEDADVALAAAEAKLLSLGQDMYRWVNGLLHYWVQITDKQVTLLAAAVAAAAATDSRGGSTSSSSSTSSSGSAGSHSEALCDLLKLAAKFDVLYALADMPYLSTRLPALNPWQEHSVAVVALLERLIRTVLTPGISSSSSLGASAQQELLLLRQHTETALTKLITCRQNVKATPLTMGAACCPTHGVELRRHLFGLALSHFKLSGLQGHSADCASIMALTHYVVAIGCFLATRLQEDYTLAAVRAAVAPWLVLVGRLHRLLADLLRENITAATALLAQGSADNEGAADELLSAVSVLVKAAAVSLLRVHQEMLECFTHPETEQYKGTRQYPDPEAVGDHYTHHHHQQQHTHSSSSSVSVHHLQHPGLAVEKVVSLPAAAAAGTVAGGSAGTPGAAASGSSSSVAAVECVLLDDLDSWADSELHSSLFQRAVAAQNTLCLQHSALKDDQADLDVLAASPGQEQPDEEACDLAAVLLAQARSRARKPPLDVLQGVLERGLLQPLPELLHADGTALCNLLPVPWCCNNAGCSNMGCDSEMVLVGGKACCCASCKVARYCGRECQSAHWKQHKPVCKRLAARAAAARAAPTVQQ